MDIPGNVSFSSHTLNFDDVVVEVGEYYYSDKNKEIEKRKNKRKRGDTTIIQPSSKIIIGWKEGPDPKLK